MDRPTDILSWSYYEEDPEVEWVGDLMLSLPRVQLQAEENGWDLRTELVRMLAHGCAHLAGWDHELSVEEAEAMLKCEKLMLEKAGFDKIYNAIIPTPPVAPEIKIGFLNFFFLFSKSFITASDAVNPAVPNIIDFFTEKLIGIF